MMIGCVNKPSGMSLHPGGGRRKIGERVLTTSLKRQLSRKVYPVHRLDHRTSGALLVAFSSERAASLHDGLKSAEKVYVALLRGHWGKQFESGREQPSFVHTSRNTADEEPSAIVDKPLTINGEEKEAQTRFTVLGTGYLTSSITGRDETMSCTLVEAKPVTGRTHQIRRHAYVLGMPIIGDTEYGDSRVNR